MGSSTSITDLYVRETHIIPASSPATNVKHTVRRELAEPLKLSVHEYKVHGTSDELGFNVILTHGTSFNKYLWQLRPVIGIGHSFGGGAMCHAAMMEPEQFAATILIEPILFQMRAQTEAVANLALKRRDWWASADEVATTFFKSQGFQDWDERQLRMYIEHGTYPVDRDSHSSPRMLKTPKEQEAATYLARPCPEILGLLQQSRRRHHFIWGSASKVISATRRDAIERIIRPPSTSQVLPGAGHLIPMTHPEALATVLEGILQDASHILQHRTKL
ncbi:hypothetical protein NKR23_g8721 [Pleurostoma richardsiae]|uniref:AB hydrolase-1 domain-containing protein n=1 Tax=Pleurostoma richardsiae TaxID=41990 RepID=A0AA38R7I8_9PEZI|nr:hypothetical protein NKR23_g8721 [Pleurostoma richardsiae]